MSTFLLQTPRHISGFLIWWIYQMPANIFRWFEGALASLDNNLQFGRNLRLWIMLEPLFGDYGWRGRMIGFLMRGIRAIFTLITYLAVFILGLICIAGWIALIPAAVAVIAQLI